MLLIKHSRVNTKYIVVEVIAHTRSVEFHHISLQLQTYTSLLTVMPTAFVNLLMGMIETNKQLSHNMQVISLYALVMK